MADKNKTNKQNKVALKASKCCNATVERTVDVLPYDFWTFRLYTYTCSKCKKVIREREYIIDNVNKEENRKSRKEMKRYNIIFR